MRLSTREKYMSNNEKQIIVTLFVVIYCYKEASVERREQ